MYAASTSPHHPGDGKGDVATGGLGLSKVGSDIGRNDIVVIEMFNGRRLTGSVMWAKDGLAGVKFATPLGLNDPLIAA